MKFKAIVFDFDGVLFDSEKLHFQACNEVFRDLGFSISEEEYFDRYVGLSDNEMFPLIFNHKNIKCSLQELNGFRSDKINAYRAIINSSGSLSGFLNVKKFIHSYSNKVEFAICSGSTKIEVETTLEKLENGELKNLFNHIITVEDVKMGKPSPEGYLLAAKRLGLFPQYCLAIEDTQKGATAAKEAGMSVVALSTNNVNFKNIDLIAKNYEEIDAWLSQESS